MLCGDARRFQEWKDSPSRSQRQRIRPAQLCWASSREVERVCRQRAAGRPPSFRLLGLKRVPPGLHVFLPKPHRSLSNCHRCGELPSEIFLYQPLREMPTMSRTSLTVSNFSIFASRAGQKPPKGPAKMENRSGPFGHNGYLLFTMKLKRNSSPTTSSASTHMRPNPPLLGAAARTFRIAGMRLR